MRHVSRGNDEYILIAQRCQSLSQLHSLLGVQIKRHGYLKNRNIGIGKQVHEWNPGTVIKPSMVIASSTPQRSAVEQPLWRSLADPLPGTAIHTFWQGTHQNHASFLAGELS